MRVTIVTLALALCTLLTPAAAQASFTPYGQNCPATTRPLQINGLPKLGTSFTVSGILFPGFCTRKFCPCPCCDCNDCNGSMLFLGIGKVRFTLPGGCDMLTSSEISLIGDIRGNLTIPVPNFASLIGAKFYMQRADLSLKEVTGTQCNTTYRLQGIRGTSAGVEARIGR